LAIRRWLVRGAVVALAFGAAALIGGFAYELSLPGVGDAEMRVQRILHAHGGSDSGLPLPRKLASSVVAVEDEHFYSNVVVDVLDGAGRAALATLHTSRDPGGSTIAQQLAKQLYGHGGGLLATLQEIGLAVKLSLSYPKTRILEMYLNAVYYGHGYWGDAAAAHGCFGESPSALDWAQAAMLAGLPQAPSAYDPFEDYASAKQRQRHVLDRLVANHYLTPAEANAAFAEPLALASDRRPPVGRDRRKGAAGRSGRG
jgi:penicillin-binding protein 1A